MPAENVRADVLALPDTCPHWAATLIEPLACVVRGQRWAGVGAGSRVAVVGAGAMGLLEIRAARTAGAAAVAAVEPRADRRALAEAAGATALAGPSRTECAPPWAGGSPTRSLSAQPTGRRSPAPSTSPARGAWSSSSRRRRPASSCGLDLGSVFFREVSIQSTYSAGPFDTRDALALLASGAVDAATLVSHRLPLDEVAEAFRLARSGEATKVVVEP